MKFWKIASIVITLVLSTNVNAAVVSADWLSAGDSLITRDTTSGLDWLDLTVTSGMSYNSVLSEQAANGQFSGYRNATTEEVVTLWLSNFGIDLHGGHVNNALFPEGLSRATDLLGDTMALCTFCSNDNTGVMGITGEYELGSDPSRHLQVGVNYDLFWGTLHRRLDSGTTNSPDDRFSNAHVGHWLVSDGPWQPAAAVVPVPAAVWLFGSGLLGLIGVARRKTHC